MYRNNLLIYVSGNYENGHIAESIHKTREAAIQIWEAGYTALTPHLSTAQYWKDCPCSQKDYLDGITEIITRCDAIFLIDGWDDSDFALKEYENALAEVLPVFHTVDQLNEYFKGCE